MGSNFLDRSLSIELFPFKEAQFRIIDLKKIQKIEASYAEQFLDKSTLEKVKKIISEEGRNKATVTHAILRYHLGRLIQRIPNEIPLLMNKFGKLYLKDKSIYFNIAHTKDFAFIAFHPNRPIGVDIENVNKDIDVLKLSDGFMLPNERKILLINPSKAVDCFFSFWCAKEAFLKALGFGLLVKKIPEIHPNFDDLGFISSFYSKKLQEIYIYNGKIEDHKLAVCVIHDQGNPTSSL